MSGPRIDLIVKPGAVSWRMWKGSRIVGASSESYRQRARAISNLETVTGGEFEKISTPDFPKPFGLLTRRVPSFDVITDESGTQRIEVSAFQQIPVRLVES